MPVSFNIPRLPPCSVVVPSDGKIATAVTLGLWEPAKQPRSPMAKFTLQEMPLPIPPPPPSLVDSVHNPANFGQEPSPRGSVAPGPTPVPPGFVNVHVAIGGSEADKENTPSKQAYLINRKLLGRYCGHFSSNAIATSKHADNFKLSLPPDLDLANSSALDHLFPIFNNWLHSGYLHTSSGTPAHALSLLILSRLYVFGMLLSAPLFSNAVVDAIVIKSRPVTVFDEDTEIIHDAIMYVYGLPYMELRSAVLEYVVRNAGPWIVAAFEWPSVAKRDCLDLLFAAAREGLEWRGERDRCRLHVHEKGDKCAAKKE